MIKFLIPGFYLFYSRLKRKSEILSFLLVYPVIIFLLTIIQTDLDVINFTFLFILAMIAWLSFYEIGYLENDAITIKKEQNPTLRIEEEEIKIIQGNFVNIQIIRYLFGVGFLLLIFYLSEFLDIKVDIFYFALVILLARLAFYFHNTLRSRWNILTYFSLSLAKYVSIPILFLSGFDLLIVSLSLFFIFPLPRTIEHSVKVKYDLKKLKKFVRDLDSFRVKYYLAGSILSIILFFIFDKNWLSTLLVGFLWFFIFRFGIFILIKKGTYKRTYFESHNWKNKK